MLEFACHGDILYSSSIDQLKVFEDCYLVVRDGAVEGIFSALPAQYAGMPVKDLSLIHIFPVRNSFVLRG